MPRRWTPRWTLGEDRTLRTMYTRPDPMQLIRDTLHRSGPDIHERARQLRLQRPSKEPHPTKRPPTKRPRDVRRSIHSARAADTLRRYGFAPVYAQRQSDLSTKETGLWVVGTMLMKADEMINLASKYERIGLGLRTKSGTPSGRRPRSSDARFSLSPLGNKCVR